MMMNWKGFGRKRSRRICKVLSQHSPWTEENLNEGSRSSGPRPEHYAGVITTRPGRSVRRDGETSCD
jgi:hypothetical protein